MCSVCGEPDGESKVKHVLDDEYTCICGAEFTAQIENGAEISVIAKLYNLNDKLIKELTYVNEELIYFDEYYYDENDNLAKEENYLADGTLDYYTLFEYDESGNETKREFYLGDGTPDGTTLSEYNENGDIIKETYTIDDYEIITKYEYDEKGNLLKEAYEDIDGYFYVCEYEYDENGNLLKDVYEDSDGYFYVCEYEYDEKGNLLKEAYEDSDGTLDITEYEYDENENLTKYSYEVLTADNHLIGYEKYSENGGLTETWIKFGNGSQLLIEYYEDGVTAKRETHTDVDETKTVKDFDESGRIVKETITYPDGSVVIYE